jgi:shikimate dehydrogenase
MIGVAAVLGDPIAQSLSPRLHQHWLRMLGLEGHYVPLRVSSDLGAEVMRALAHTDLLGANVTAPLKAIAARAADHATDRVQRLGVANLLRFEGGQIAADNTDILAFDGLVPISETMGKTILILGAGDTARMVVGALADRGHTDLILANRTPQRALDLAALIPADVMPLYDLAPLFERAAVIINTLSPWPADVALPAVRSDQMVVDYSYTGAALTTMACARSVPIVDGYDLLVAQARPSFEVLFGYTAPWDDAAALLRGAQ